MKTFHIPRLITTQAVAIVAAFAAVNVHADLFVSSQTPAEIVRYDGLTGSYLSATPLAGDALGLAFGPDGNLYAAADTQILRFDGKTGNSMGVFASGGGMQGAINLTFGPDGNLYVSSGYSQILRFNGKTGAFIDTFISDTSLAYPRGLKFGPDGNLYVVSYNSASVLRYNGTNGAFMNTFVSSGSGGLFTPSDLAFGPDGNLYVSGGTYPYPGVFRFNGHTGAFVNMFASTPVANQMLPIDITFGPDKNLYVVTGGAVSSVLRFNGTTGSFIDYFVPNGSGGIGNPFGIAFPPVPMNKPPTITCPDPVSVTLGTTAEVTAGVSDPDGDALTVIWNLNGAPVQTNQIATGVYSNLTPVSFSSALPLGTNVVGVTVTDTASNSVSCSTTVTVAEPPAPVIVSASADPASLWPPNHQFVQVTITAQVDDRNSPTTWKIVAVSSSLNGNADGPNAPRWMITGDHTVQLLATRPGNGQLAYSITIQASDAYGNLSQPVAVEVPVLHDQRPNVLNNGWRRFNRDH